MKTHSIILYDRFIISLRNYSIIISVIITAVIAVVAWNTNKLNSILKQNTLKYVSDVSYQLSSNISYRLRNDQIILAQLADSIARLQDFPDDAILTEFLDRKAGILGFDMLAAIDREGDIFPGFFEFETAAVYEGVRSSFRGEASVVCTEEQDFLFSVPVYDNGTIVAVLAGARKKENIQKLLHPHMFWTKSISCIINSDGEIVLRALDRESLPHFGNSAIFENRMDPKNVIAITQMKKDMKSGKSGIFDFISVSGARSILSYNNIAVNDWVLVTLIAEDVITGNVTSLMLQIFFIIIASIVCIFVPVLIRFIFFHRVNIKKLEKLALEDPLTGGMNNAGFQIEYEKLVREALPHTYSIVLFNIKNFKIANESIGIDAGDRILQCVFTVLKNHISGDEFLCREEADNFFLCLKDIDQEKIRLRINVMIRDIDSTLQSYGYLCFLSFYCGAYVVDNPALDVINVQNRARMACYRKREDVCTFYTEGLVNILQSEQELNTLFLSSIENHDFHIFLQPKVRLSDGKVLGAEALVRWFSAEKGVICPSDFIPLLERSRNICTLDLYVFEQVCILIDRWRREGRMPVLISCNLSRKHIYVPQFLDRFFKIADQYQIPAGSIEFEITESIALNISQISQVQSVIERIHSRGFLCSLDDFGFGYSSLALFKNFDVDALKLDKKFFDGNADAKGKQVIETFIELAKKLGICTVAEGIETEEQLAYLKDAGCDMVQGYVFSKPLSIPDFEKWLEGWQDRLSV